ncbi:phage tail length tape measure family protein [Phaeovulum vinaykumarii]|uniref:Prophage tail length tape measure protein n=1 Tax=Phaeovulum vinaykumarii TaxID=407234 RepID=A0A1N7KB43_9RHOB|nr:phage tail length tape measure family protein [Phaeovulum vinaykumarii]SIS58730.1 Prophage tail length tape measure protein [Phaeovulum vinaykumarii]SOB93898.1 tail length tape measure protein [Phaeovulum vinaykumarii]
MELISDILLGAGALGAAVYCIVLAKRLKRFNQLENGMGGAIAVLSAQVDDMTKALQKAQSTSASSAATLQALTDRAEKATERLELLLASLHDLPESPGPEDGARRPRVVRRRARHEGHDSMEAAE